MWFFGLIVVLLIGAVAVVASGRWGAMSTAYDDRPDMTVPARQALTATDIESARFAVGVRGYRMDEVDTLLERIAKEVAERDRRIADLERAVAPIVDAPEGYGFTSTQYDPTDFDDTGTHQPILVGGDFPDTPTEPTAEDEPELGDSAAGGKGGGSPEDGSEDSVASAPTAEASTPAGPAAEDPTPAGPAPEDSTPAGPAADHSALTDAATGGSGDEYERLQAEARAVLEAQSQPGAPRRTPAPQTPQSAPLADHPAPSAQSPDAPQQASQPTTQEQQAEHADTPVEHPAPTQQPPYGQPTDQPSHEQPASRPSVPQQSVPQQPGAEQSAPEHQYGETPGEQSASAQQLPYGQQENQQSHAQAASQQSAPEQQVPAQQSAYGQPQHEQAAQQAAQQQPVAPVQQPQHEQQSREQAVHWTALPDAREQSEEPAQQPDVLQQPAREEQQPQYGQLSQQQPSEQQPSYGQPSEQQPSYGQVSEQPPSYGQEGSAGERQAAPEQSDAVAYEQHVQQAAYSESGEQEGADAERAASGNGVVGDDGEGWRFWPPADQNDGAYQRPS